MCGIFIRILKYLDFCGKLHDKFGELEVVKSNFTDSPIIFNLSVIYFDKNETVTI